MNRPASDRVHAYRDAGHVAPDGDAAVGAVRTAHGERSLQWPAVPWLLAAYAAIWSIVRPYAGLIHDSQLYALLTLARLEPEVYLGDLFLRFGSQDEFTVFSRVMAPLARPLGLEVAAALLTFGFSLLWLAAGFLVAREFTGTRLALLALGLLVAVPGWYGPFEVFSFAEPFLSARLPGEALGLCALLAYLRGRPLLAAVLCAAAAAVHPIMAAPVIGLLVLATIRSRSRAMMARLAVVTAILGGTLLTLAMPTGPIPYFDEWLGIVKVRSPFLFPGTWRFVDWQYHAPFVVTLLIAGWTAADSRLRSIAASGAWLAVAGICLAAIAAALPEHPTLLRLQPWRSLWLVGVLAVIALPGTLRQLWNRGAGTVERPAALLLAAGWLLADSVGGVVALAALATLVALPRVRAEQLRMLAVGAWSILAAAVVITVVTAIQFAAIPIEVPPDPMWVHRIVNGIGSPSAALLAAAACWALAVAPRAARRASALVLAATAALLVVAIGPRAHRDWTRTERAGTIHAAFAPWRAVIPEDAEVLWPANPMDTWLLLERRSYFSQDQLAGLIFSPGLMPELRARAAALRAYAAPQWWTGVLVSDATRPKDLTAAIVADVCRAPGLDYFVYDSDVGNAVASLRIPGRETLVYLYACRQARTRS